MTHTSPTPGRCETHRRLDVSIAFALSVVAIVSSAFHFWPFSGSRTWQFFMPANAAILLWCGGVLAAATARRVTLGTPLLPDVSVTAFLCVAVMSLGVAGDASRSATYAVKLALGYLGAYALFKYAAARGGARLLYKASCLALTVAVASCLLGKAAGTAWQGGFFGDIHKYGSFVGVLAAFCVGALLSGSGKWPTKLFGVAAAVLATISMDSLGGVAAIAAGLVVSLVCAPGRTAKLSIACALVLALTAVAVARQTPSGAGLRSDAAVMEPGGADVRQRYIEWQAELNLLEERPASGSGAGCINVYRSMYYYRLPKQNTMGPFEQNGWLAVAAETGLLGLVCFCGIVWRHAAKALRSLASGRTLQRQDTGLRVGCVAALAAACVAHVFSSLHYNGVLVAFVLILALVDGADEPVNTHDGN